MPKKSLINYNNSTFQINVMKILGIVFAAVVITVTPSLDSGVAHAEPAGAEIGGRFMLETHEKKIITDQDFHNKFMLITFGYTFCPDVCPTNLANISNSLETLGDKAEQIVPIFITVDPGRDTADQLRDYLEHFDERIIGLTGPQPMIDNVKKKYKVISEIHRPKDWDKGDYIVDHTGSIFLMSTDGTFLVKFAHGMDPDAMAKRISDFML
ncbi:MAG: SCO family protein [Magnetovibrio sp.]|nr:SCO family protein [Magnetovibrio sp.]